MASRDPVVRAQALEAAEAVGGSLGRQVVPILEFPNVAVEPARALMIELVADDDPWVRVLALRCVAELAAQEWTTVVEPATHDPDPRVRQTAAAVMARMDPEMAPTLDTVGRLDRMLLLRAVPIFESLLPDDLERLAENAVEHSYRDGDTIFTTGDVTQQLLLVVEGAVELTVAAEPGVETLERGMFIGELATLCGLPRAGDAVAHGPTRVLAVNVSSIERLLDDRPEVARQMLSILAKRLAGTADDSRATAPPARVGDP